MFWQWSRLFECVMPKGEDEKQETICLKSFWICLKSIRNRKAYFQKKFATHEYPFWDSWYVLKEELNENTNCNIKIKELSQQISINMMYTKRLWYIHFLRTVKAHFTTPLIKQNSSCYNIQNEWAVMENWIYFFLIITAQLLGTPNL